MTGQHSHSESTESLLPRAPRLYRNKYFESDSDRCGLNSCWIFGGRHVVCGQQIEKLLALLLFLHSEHKTKNMLCMNFRWIFKSIPWSSSLSVGESNLWRISFCHFSLVIYTRIYCSTIYFKLKLNTYVSRFEVLGLAGHSHLSGNSMSSMVSGRGTPLVSGSIKTKTPARKASRPAHNIPC